MSEEAAGGNPVVDEGVLAVSGLQMGVAESNMLHAMWNKYKVEESFYKNYE